MNVIEWFIRLLHKDMLDYPIDSEEQKQIGRKVRDNLQDKEKKDDN